MQASSWTLIYDLAEHLTGQIYTPQQKDGLLRNNYRRRFRQLGFERPEEYLTYLHENEDEWSQFISLSTIHTTSWFREEPHFQFLRRQLETCAPNLRGPFRVLVAACSTGQEAYSLGLLLEEFRFTHPTFDYRIEAFDIDPVSVMAAERAVYRRNGFPEPYWAKYKRMLLEGRNRAEGFFSFSPEIRKRMMFRVGDICDLPKFDDGFDWIMCRNVLIYFDMERVPAIARGLAGHLRAGGQLCIGHSESFDAHSVGLRLITNSIYSPIDGKDKTPVSAPGPAPIKGAKRALVVDDSGVVRKKLSSILVGAGFEVSEACDGMAADREISKQAYDFITVDLHMPGDDGVTWIRKVRQKGNRTPAVMVSDSTLEDAPQILEVLGKEIHDFFDKKTLHSHPEYLIEKAKALTALVPAPRPVERSKNRKTLPDLGFSQADVILVGASTGGTTALIELLQNIPKPCPPVVVVQHITPNFLKPFAERLARAAGLELGESTAGAHLKSGFLYMAHGDYHVGVGIEKGLLALKTSTEGPISRHRPSVDYLFSTASQIAKHPILGILMTGMGADGASGLLQLKRAGGFTACQSEESCVVFGMPKEAIRMGADRFVGSIEELRSLFIKAGGKSS